MSEKITACQRFLNAAGSLVLLGLVAVPLQAAAQDKPASAPPGDVQSSDNLTVVRDADTGKLRAPTPEEHQAMKARADQSKDMRIGTKHMLPKAHASGARGTRLTDESVSTSVMVRMPDGSIQEQCFDSREAADKAVLSARLPVPKYELE